ncbi:hypothetical protein N8459_03445, partial [Nitrosopumilus sp.]|nr:hypothetical protein [Nitrosopumilus sp.]
IPVTIITKNAMVFIIALLSILVVCYIYVKSSEYNGFTNMFNTKPAYIINNKNNKKSSLKKYINNNFYENTPNNPYGNVLLTEINENPNRKPAPPAFLPSVMENNKNLVKKAVQQLNPTIKDTNAKLFHSLVDKYNFDQADRQFYTTASTTIPSDQKAFADYLYGDMKSCKEGNAFACMQNNYRYINR